MPEVAVKKERYIFIDVLKAIGILYIILIHTNAYFLSVPIAYTIWNIGQVFVPVFVFSSAFLYFSKSLVSQNIESVRYIIKRTWRLLPPYYIFLIFYFTLIFFGNRSVLTMHNIVPHLIFTGGIDSNWLVLLFIYFSVLFPLVAWAFKRLRILFWIMIIISLANALAFLWISPSISYRITMIIPWLLVVYPALLYTQRYPPSKKTVLSVAAITSIVLLFSYWVLTFNHHSLQLFENKYPPNTWYLAWGNGFIMVLVALRSGIEKIPQIMRPAIVYISKKTYSIYFIHQLFIYAITVNLKLWPTSWVFFFIQITAITIAAQLSLDWILGRLHQRRSTLNNGPTI